MTKIEFNEIISSVSIKSTRVADRSDGASWGRGASHYKILLKRNGKQWTFPYSMGSAHKTGPKKKDVLWSLVCDAQCYANARNESDFIDEFGYERDEYGVSDAGRKAYRACKATHARINGDFFTRAEFRILENGYQDY